MVLFENPIKALCLHTVKVKLNPEVLVDIEVNVARSEDEAERQAKGEDVIAMAIAEEKADTAEANAERAANAVSMFEGDAPDEVVLGDDLGNDSPNAEAIDDANPAPEQGDLPKAGEIDV